MKEKGFTLIELLAVIVILAIIALIATPIILNIINDAREESNERSVELYASAVRNAVAAYQLTGTSAPTSFEDLNIQYEGNVVCSTQELYEDGNFYLEGCKVNNGKKEYSYGTKQESEVAKVCTIERSDASKYSVGDIVTCTLSESTDKFYIIVDAELSASTIQMLTEKNINTTTYRQSDDAGGVAFSTTSYWSSETTFPADVYNENNDIVKPIVDQYVNYLRNKLINSTGSLLTYTQAKSLGCDDSSNSCTSAPTWLYSTMYYTSSAYDDRAVFLIDTAGNFFSGFGDNSSLGVRPVITISTSDIQ